MIPSPPNSEIAEQWGDADQANAARMDAQQAAEELRRAGIERAEGEEALGAAQGDVAGEMKEWPGGGAPGPRLEGPRS